MLFKARNKEGFWKRFRVWAWPRTSWGRSWRYYLKRVMRLSANPHSVAAGCASGVAVSFTPFVGFHFIASFVVAFFVRGNMLAAAIGTAAGNPITFPFIWAATYEVGQRILGQGNGGPPSSLGQTLMEKSISTIWPTIQVMLIGCIPFVLISALVSYVLVYKLVSSYQNRKRERMAKAEALSRNPSISASLADDTSNGGRRNPSGG